MNTVFVVQHARGGENGAEDVKFIGVYSTRNNAESAVSRFRKLKGFKDYPGGFVIDEYPLDKDHWQEGFLD